MSEDGSMTIWLKSPHGTSSVLGPGYVRANYSASETVKNEVLGTSPDMIGDVFKFQMVYPSAKNLGRPRDFRSLVTVRTHLERDSSYADSLGTTACVDVERGNLRRVWCT